MNGKYNLNELAMMTGFTTRTLRNYLNMGLLEGEKTDGTWQFSAEDLDRFFKEPFVREGLRTKRNSVVFDFLADRKKETPRTCTVLDIPASVKRGNEISAFFCEQMKDVSDTVFFFGNDSGVCRVILSGAEDQVAKIMKAYYSSEFTVQA
jgi:hypothetical protein